MTDELTNKKIVHASEIFESLMDALGGALIETVHDEDIEPDMIGTCDECDVQYDISSRSDHCPECGTCWEHCPNNHTEMSIRALDELLLTEDDFDDD